jgi:hypothetical protein
VVGEMYGFPCRRMVLGKYKLQRVSLRTPDPPSYNSLFTANDRLHLYRNVGGFQKGPTAVTTAAYPTINRGTQGNRRITCSPDTASAPLATTIAQLCLTSRINTIALHKDTERRSREHKLSLPIMELGSYKGYE